MYFSISMPDLNMRRNSNYKRLEPFQKLQDFGRTLLNSAFRAESVGLLISTVFPLTLRCCRYSHPARLETVKTTPLNPILQAVSQVACPRQTKLSGSTLKRVNGIICESIRCPFRLMLSLLLVSELVNISACDLYYHMQKT